MRLMSNRHTLLSYLLPLFALAWLVMLYAAETRGHTYSADAVFNRRGNDAVVVSAAPSAQRLGLRPGAIVLVSRMSYVDMIRFRYAAPLGMNVSLLVDDGTHVRTIVLPATKRRSVTPPIQIAFNLLAGTFSLLLAGYLGYRKPGIMPAALILFLGGGVVSWPSAAVLFSGLPDAFYVPLVRMLADLCDWFPVLVLASFAIRLPGDKPVGRRLIAVAIVDSIVVLGFLSYWLPQTQQTLIASTAVAAAVLFAASLISLHFARPSDRGRVGIVFAGVLVGGVGYAINMITLRLGVEGFLIFSLYAMLSIIVVPLSVTYAILRHRVFDIGFVLNRTIVYALTSALVVLLFAALEFSTERFVSDFTHVEGLAVQFGIALLVIVSVRLVHGRVDRVVDSILFRSRHEQESALRRYATTVQFYTDEAPLIRDTVDALERFGRVQGAAVYVARSGGGLECAHTSFPATAPAIDENDTAFVEMRAHHEILNAHGRPTAFPGARLYPMILAGRIGGVIATGDRESLEEMPPDIDDAIAHIAAALAVALAAIETDRIRQQNAALQAQLTQALPA